MDKEENTTGTIPGVYTDLGQVFVMMKVAWGFKGWEQ